MLRGLYTATAGMRVQQLKQDNIADNLANVNTPGFQAGTIQFRSFPEILMFEKGQSRSVGRLNTGVLADEISYGFKQGNVEETGRNTDLAIVGEGFLQVRDGKGELYYTRNGALVVEDGYLATSTGRLVLDTAGQPINIDGDFAISEAGQVQGSAQQISVVSFEDYGQLERAGAGLWQTPVDNVSAMTAPTVKQGYVESSNVDISTAMVDMIASLRLYQFNSRALQAIDSTLERAVTEIGRV